MKNFFTQLFTGSQSMEPTTEQVVIVSFRLSDEFGTEDEQAQVLALEDELDPILQDEGIGDVDGHRFGGGEGQIYMYGVDAQTIYDIARPYIEKLKFRPIHVTLRYGAVDDNSAQESIEEIK